MTTKKLCEKCNTYKDLKDFYSRSDDNTKISSWCKECIHNNLKNNDIFQILKICKELDIPFIKAQWNKFNDIYPDRLNIGRYLSLMKLKGYKHFHFKDSDYLNELEN